MPVGKYQLAGINWESRGLLDAAPFLPLSTKGHDMTITELRQSMQYYAAADAPQAATATMREALR